MPDATPSLEQMLSALKRQAGSSDKALPPVDQWNPAHCGEIGMEILADGTWRHEGTPITRESLVRLFASILRKDTDGATYLVTPAEKIRVRVEDAPFLAVRADCAGAGRDQTVVFTTNVGDVVALDAAHPLRVTHALNGESRPTSWCAAASKRASCARRSTTWPSGPSCATGVGACGAGACGGSWGRGRVRYAARQLRSDQVPTAS